MLIIIAIKLTVGLVSTRKKKAKLLKYVDNFELQNLTDDKK